MDYNWVIIILNAGQDLEEGAEEEELLNPLYSSSFWGRVAI